MPSENVVVEGGKPPRSSSSSRREEGVAVEVVEGGSSSARRREKEDGGSSSDRRERSEREKSSRSDAEAGGSDRERKKERSSSSSRTREEDREKRSSSRRVSIQEDDVPKTQVVALDDVKKLMMEFSNQPASGATAPAVSEATAPVASGIPVANTAPAAVPALPVLSSQPPALQPLPPQQSQQQPQQQPQQQQQQPPPQPQQQYSRQAYPQPHVPSTAPPSEQPLFQGSRWDTQSQYAQQHQAQYLAPHHSNGRSSYEQQPSAYTGDGTQPGKTEACERCRAYASQVYCAHCDALLCAGCETAEHPTSHTQAHQRVPVANAHMHRRRCAAHPTGVIKYFCETCDVGACADCRVFGSHQGPSHRVVGLGDAFHRKLGALRDRVHTSLLPKRDQLAQRLSSTQRRLGEVQAMQDAREMEARRQLDKYLHQLDGMAGDKAQWLKAEERTLLAQLDQIESVVARVSSAAPRDPAEVLDFLARFREIWVGTQSLLQQQHHRPAVESVTVNDLPSFGAESDARTQALAKLLAVKDQMVWLMLREKESAEAAGGASTSSAIGAHPQNSTKGNSDDRPLDEAAKAEIMEWMVLSDRYADALKRFQQHCCFCSATLSPELLNSDCAANTPSARNDATIDGIAAGSGRHCWVADDGASTAGNGC